MLVIDFLINGLILLRLVRKSVLVRKLPNRELRANSNCTRASERVACQFAHRGRHSIGLCTTTWARLGLAKLRSTIRPRTSRERDERLRVARSSQTSHQPQFLPINSKKFSLNLNSSKDRMFYGWYYG